MADRTGEHFGNYRLVRLLGQGGFAEVYLGQHLRLNLQAAIKVLHTHLTSQEAEHFEHEAETIAQLQHPSIVRILDYDVQEGVPFLVMEYAAGGSLRQRYPKGSVVPLPFVISSVKQVAAALQYAHERKFIHRDVKPENMLLGRQEEIVLSDFGLAALSHGSGSLSTKEATGTLVYMAPEQIEGHPRAASDQYALGCVVYEWLCGARPFEGSPTEVMVQQLSMPPAPLYEKVASVPLEIEQVVLRALAKDPKARFASVRDFAAVLEEAAQHASSPTSHLPGERPLPGSRAPASFGTITVPDEASPAAVVSSMSPETPAEPDTSPGLTGNAALAGTMPATPLLVTTPAEVPSLPRPSQHNRKTIAGLPATLLIGLAVLVVAGGILGSLSLLARFGVIGPRSGATTLAPVRGGTWTDDLALDPDSLIPNGGSLAFSAQVDQALYLPLFYGDAQGLVHPGAASEMPTLQNGGISADATTWTFHLRPGLVWSDGAPYDARDFDFTWRLWLNPKFGAAFPNGATGYELIRSANVSADHLSITFHLKQAYAPFLSYWVDGIQAPLPAHHFSSMPPGQILKSPDNLNPQVVSGPFMMAERVPGDHYTLVRNPSYYRAREGLPYLDKLVFRIANPDAIVKDLQAGSIDSAWFLDLEEWQAYQRLKNYILTPTPTSASFEALFFNFHNTILASHLEVRQAMAMAIDQQSLIKQARHGFATPLCTDHPSALHPGYDPNASVGSYGCPVVFDPALANQLLEDHGWVKGADGVRTKGGQRLEFEYSTTAGIPWRSVDEAILQRDFMEIGVKLDIQNYPGDTFFGSFLPGGKASPPTGAVTGRFDIAEYEWDFAYDPDDSGLLSCDQIPPKGQHYPFYCNSTLDALYQQELATPDPGVRQQLFDQIHHIYLTDFPFITLYSQLNLAMVRKGAHNYQPSPIAGETVNIWEWWCDHGKC
jgi:ABC-type transport system substrate-binding protein/serine/threonine protein kinase